ncbi:hypothetical protein ASG22_01715 [Chryseobacterium sp. Leaf405]|uniref:DUF6268 family outer membrane beta-barrel protein n=1 Tax=Chryseobacterium sp. Leaf405 TaxID=1736367 RepID=UPI0006FF7DE8|nr:DUF6268 family outer membrane beta-barrel protein [Chryseobacterium sp. Leaf405]KQT35763.1 hypothetical protein ASG22_01715 [Chryseobacterium sp. Leaf405]
MNILHKTILTSSILSISNIAFAQKRDSIPQKVTAYVAEKFPIARDFNVEFTQLTPYKFSSQLHGADLPENKVDHFSQVKVSSNINFIKTQKWVLSTTLNYRYTSLNTENSISDYRKNNDFHYHSETLSFTYFSKLFNKMTIYSASFSVDGSDEHFERMRGMLTGTMILKANAKTKMTVGLVGIIDPSTQIPIIPTFSYEHTFDNGLIADIILPKRVLIKKNVSENGRISLGSEMENTSFYIYDSNKRYEFRQLEINSGAIYEHKIGSFIGTLKTGIRTVPNARIFEKNESFKNYFFEASPKTSFYFNVGVSYNPFGKYKAK